jgi:hypothetical protein
MVSPELRRDLNSRKNCMKHSSDALISQGVDSGRTIWAADATGNTFDVSDLNKLETISVEEWESLVRDDRSPHDTVCERRGPIRRSDRGCRRALSRRFRHCWNGRLRFRKLSAVNSGAALSAYRKLTAKLTDAKMR